MLRERASSMPFSQLEVPAGSSCEEAQARPSFSFAHKAPLAAFSFPSGAAQQLSDSGCCTFLCLSTELVVLCPKSLVLVPPTGGGQALRIEGFAPAKLYGCRSSRDLDVASRHSTRAVTAFSSSHPAGFMCQQRCEVCTAQTVVLSWTCS
jgi:hypothetical protein